MNKISIRAYGKVNLVLNITAKRKDGYHDLESVFQRISLYDELILEKTSSADIELDCSLDAVALEDNIVTKAFRSLQKAFPGSCGGVKVKLEKNIPAQAGLAGGSADAAAFILAYLKLYDLSMERADLIALGAKLGADVPVCLHYGSMLTHGIGDIITPLPQNMPLYMVIIKPDVSYATPGMYHRLDASRSSFHTLPWCERMVNEGLLQASLTNVCSNLYNIFEEAVDGVEISEVKKALLASGAMGALMSGSGSAVFGLYADAKVAQAAYAVLRTKYQTYLCTEMKDKGIYL